MSSSSRLLCPPTPPDSSVLLPLQTPLSSRSSRLLCPPPPDSSVLLLQTPLSSFFSLLCPLLLQTPLVSSGLFCPLPSLENLLVPPTVVYFT
ncbi:hypothetical protein GDO81_021860 [Engystomops pustulosus]|uniref:Uncharacterized protein n=1 Tax=Engystomops pustulosus TaxID=76066 RepID=A0AAV6ZFX0_ENGPU|nr:hypothetical protein GDO81_021860 [Engystomops pustulosus]